MPPKKKAIPCKKMRWSSDLKLEVCDGSLNEFGLCGKRDLHIATLKTGFCSNGWHEGDSPKTALGNEAPTCKAYLTCPCKCHADLHKLYLMTQRVRELVNRSKYVPDLGGFWMPADDPDYTPTHVSVVADVSPPVLVESPDDTRVPALLRRTFAPTASGRLARGELETMVHIVTNEWVIEEYSFPCTPQWISDEIANSYGIEAPSTGAITAIFIRWEDLGFAVVGRKPWHFVKYTPVGIRDGLEKMKADLKKHGRLAMNDRLRNSVG